MHDTTVLTVAHAMARRAVLVTRPGRPAMTARLFAVPGPHKRRKAGAQARVQTATGAVISVPVDALTLLPEDGDQ